MVTVVFWCNFFIIFVIFSFINSGKIQRNSKTSKTNKNEAGAMYCLIYFFSSDFIVDVLIFKKYFSEFCPILKKSVGLRYPPSMGLP